jgi:hypothetical protein
MHIPDWDDRFLSRYDPVAYADLCVSAGADAVMVYCNSHAGLSYWPTGVGQVHGNLGGRDLVGETVELLHERGIDVCAYYSAIFNNWAYDAHPEWRLVASAPGGLWGAGTRYGQCCPGNPEYVAFMLAQADELSRGYEFDAFSRTPVPTCRPVSTGGIPPGAGSRRHARAGSPMPSAGCAHVSKRRVRCRSSSTPTCCRSTGSPARATSFAR